LHLFLAANRIKYKAIIPPIVYEITNHKKLTSITFIKGVSINPIKYIAFTTVTLFPGESHIPNNIAKIVENPTLKQIAILSINHPAAS